MAYFSLIRRACVLFGALFPFAVLAAATYVNSWNIGSPPYGGYSAIGDYITAYGGEAWLKEVKCPATYQGYPIKSASWSQTSSNNVDVTCVYGSEPTQAEKCAAAAADSSTSMATTSTAASLCYAGCQYDNGVSVSSSGAVKYKWVASGATCDGSEVTTAPTAADAAASSAADSACAAGMCRANGTLNGVTYNKCVACNVVETTKDTSSTSSSSSTASGVTSSKDGTVTGTEKTTCSGSTCTTVTTVTTTSSDGTSSTSSTTKTESKDDYCTSNPKAAACLSSSFGGSCKAGFTCEGDAASCAVAKAVNDTNCKLELDTTDSAVAGAINTANQALAGTLPNSDPNEKGGTASIGSFDQTNPYSATCPADLVVPIMGENLTIPLSQTCSWLAFIGYCLVAGSLVAATRIALGE